MRNNSIYRISFYPPYIYLIELTNLIPYNGQKAIKATGAPCESRRLFL